MNDRIFAWRALGNCRPMLGPTMDGRHRVVIARLSPEIDCGRFAIKRIIGETVVVEADVFGDSHDQVACRILYWQDGHEVQTSPMRPIGNDRWRGEFLVTEPGAYRYMVEGWIDHFETWCRDLEKRISAGQDVSVDVLIGAGLIERAAERATGEDAKLLRNWAQKLREYKSGVSGTAVALDTKLRQLIQYYPDRNLASQYNKQLSVIVDREKARFSTWYELFPRSCSAQPGRHGTFRDCEEWLPYVASMGFDVIYLPPIHPIGKTFRKGRNNSLPAQPDDVGSPWAIGSTEGGHKSIHPDLGTLQDFRRFVSKAVDLGVEVALDIALQCTPDHPYVQQHREWFNTRPDGTIQYADIPHRQSSYKVFFLLGMGYRRSQESVSRCALSGRGVHKAKPDVSARQAWFLTVLYLFHVAQHKTGTHRILQRTDANPSAGVPSAQSLAEYSRHSSGVSAGRGPRVLHGAPHFGRNLGSQLRLLWSRL